MRVAPAYAVGATRSAHERRRGSGVPSRPWYSLHAAPPVPDLPALEQEILEFWRAERGFDRLREQNADGPRFSFFSRAGEVVHALWWVVVELADEQPLAVSLDDAHWAEELTLRVLRTAARRASELSLALVVAARPGSPSNAYTMLAAERAFARLEPPPQSLRALRGCSRRLSGVRGLWPSSLVRAPSPAETRCTCGSC
jgi:hypothetical protein